MNVILRIEMMDAFGVDSVFEGRHRAMMAHPPVSKAATMDSSVLTKAAKPLGVPAPSNLSHEEAQIEGADMDQQALEDVASTAQVQASHSAGVIHVGEGPFDAFGPAVLQPLATRASEATSVRIHRGLGFFLVLPIASSTIGLRDMAANV